MKSIWTWLAAGFLFLSMPGCGGGGGGSGGTEPPTTLNGTFFDGGTLGLTYLAEPSGLTGITDGNGTFHYQPGDTVTFSLDVGSTDPIALGSMKPVAPSGGTAVVDVLTLNNGLQVAQVLQSLNHGTVTALDVHGLTLTSADVTTLNTYIASGGTVLPTGMTDIEMLSGMQTDALVQAPSLAFAVPGGASATVTLANVEAALQGITATSFTTLSSVLPGSLVFYQGISTGAGDETSIDFGFIKFNTNDTISIASLGSGSTFLTGSSYSVTSNTLTIGDDNTVTVQYLDTVQGLWTNVISGDLPSTGAGTYAFLQAALTPSVIAGKTLTITGALGATCAGKPIQLVINGNGTAYTENCQDSDSDLGTGVVATTSVSGILTFSDGASGDDLFVGLVEGGSIDSGSLAIVTGSGSVAIDGIFGVTAQ